MLDFNSDSISIIRDAIIQSTVWIRNNEFNSSQHTSAFTVSPVCRSLDAMPTKLGWYVQRVTVQITLT